MVAGFALAARIHHAAHADQIARLEAGDILADAAYAADDLVARHDRVGGAAPVVAGGVQVAVADAGVEDVDDDIVRPGIASLEAEGDQGLVGCVGSIAVDVLGHGRSLLGVGARDRKTTGDGICSRSFRDDLCRPGLEGKEGAPPWNLLWGFLKTLTCRGTLSMIAPSLWGCRDVS